MKKSIRLLTICLAVLMLLTTLAACNNKNPNGEPATSEENKDQEGYKQFGGYEFHVLTEISDWQTHEFDSESAPSGTVEEALFKRNLRVEDLLDIDIIEHQVAHDQKEIIVPQIEGGAYTYDLIIGMGNWWFFHLLGSGLLVDMGNIQSMDLSASCWDKNAVRDLSVLNRNYAVTGDLHCAALDATSMMLLNREFLAQYEDLSDPTDMVLAGTWTYEEYYKMIEEVSAPNADGTWDEQSTYGMTTTTAIYTNLVVSCGHNFFKKNSFDIPESAFDASLQEKFNTMLTYVDNQHTLVRNTKDQNERPEPYRQAFNTGRALFMGGLVGDLGHEGLLSSGLKDVSPIPFPKFDTNQTNYYTPVNFQAELVMMPIGKNAEDVGYITQKICELSTDGLRSTYYDVILKTRRVVDERDSQVLDLVYASRSYDIGQISEAANIRSEFNKMCDAGDTGISSFVDKFFNTANRLLIQTYESVAEKYKITIA